MHTKSILLFSVTVLIVSALRFTEIDDWELEGNVDRHLTETDRIKNWKEKGNVWPPVWHEETAQYKAVMAAREAEIMQLTGGDERWENWMQFTQGQLVRKFTEYGFEVVPTPAHVHKYLVDAITPYIESFDDIPDETGVEDSIYGPYLPKIIDVQPQFSLSVLKDLKAIHQDWIGGIELVGTSAYGVRLYRNGSSLVMHHDKVRTHAISSIVHLVHEYDNDDEPWPIQIEDHNGQVHSVSLAPGEMLLYESARCLHGRMTQLKGKFYGSIFVHYMPRDKSVWNYTSNDVVDSVPPHWRRGIVEDHGSRWAGQAITVDSRAPAGAPPRVVKGKYIHDNISPHSEL